jgi:hypothetical protein
VDAGYQGRGKEWAEQEIGVRVEVVHRTPKPIPEKIVRIWAQEWAKEGKEVDWQRLIPRRGSRSYRGAGLWNAPSRGSLRTGGRVGTTSDCVPPVRPSSTWR